MQRLLIVGLALGTAMFALPGHQAAAYEGCYTVRSTADARNPQIATDRAKRHLQRYIGKRLNTLAGKTVSPIRTTCIRNACEAIAVICPK